MSLSPRDRRALADLERRLAAEEPRLARRLSRPLGLRRVHVSMPLPAVLLVIGLALLVAGGVSAQLPAIIIGAVLAVAGPVLVSSATVRGVSVVLATDSSGARYPR